MKIKKIHIIFWLLTTIPFAFSMQLPFAKRHRDRAITNKSAVLLEKMNVLERTRYIYNLLATNFENLSLADKEIIRASFNVTNIDCLWLNKGENKKLVDALKVSRIALINQLQQKNIIIIDPLAALS